MALFLPTPANPMDKSMADELTVPSEIEITAPMVQAGVRALASRYLELDGG